MAKRIDPVEVKKAIKEGQLKAYTKYNRLKQKTEIFLQDTETGDTVLIGEEVTDGKENYVP